MSDRLCVSPECISILSPMAKKDRCTTCLHRARSKTHSKKPEAKEKRNARLKEQRVRPRLGSFQAHLRALKERPCSDCEVSYPYFVMDWDHRPGEEKLFTVGEWVGRKPQYLILAEMEKCDLVCSNCHRIRTARRKGWQPPL